MLHEREKIYRSTEDKLIKMIAEYRTITEHEEALKLELKKQESTSANLTG